MSLILALWNRSGEPVNLDVAQSMLAVNVNPESDGQDFWLQEDVLLAHQHFWITPEERNQPQPRSNLQNGCVITCTARLDNRTELIHALGLADLPAYSLSDADLIMKAYSHWGTECPRHLLGDFAFVLWDTASRCLFAARDALGGQDLCYILSRQYVMLATRLNILLEHPAVQPKLNETKIAEFLAIRWGDDINTFYDSILHLPPAHCLLVTAENFRLWRYWEADAGRTIHYARQEQYAEHYLELIKEALRGRLRCAFPLGISLSGGLDSASLACLAAEVLAEMDAPAGTLGSYSYVFDQFSNCDERAFIQPVIEQAAHFHPIRPRMVKGDNLWPRPFNPDWLILRDYPGQDPYYYLVQAILQAAHHDGVRVMLSGFYGDDLYSGTDSWFADLMLSGRVWEAARVLARSVRQVDLKRDLLEHGLLAMVPAGLKKGYRRLRPASAEWAGWVQPQLAGRIGLAESDKARLHPKFRLPGQQERYSALFLTGYPESFSGYQIYGWENGVEYVFPFADRRIVEFLLGLPADQIALPGYPRRILREALRGKLPGIVQQRQGKTDFYPLVDKGIYSESFPAISKILLHSQVLERGFIQRDWLIGELEGKNRTRDGLVLWLVLSLETWLQKYW
jgi:asparagine synthase (glutamine-hydrolysing)